MPVFGPGAAEVAAEASDPVLLDPDLAGVAAPLSYPLTSDLLSGTFSTTPGPAFIAVPGTPAPAPSTVPKILSLARLYSSSRSINVLFLLDPDLEPFPPAPGLPRVMNPPSL